MAQTLTVILGGNVIRYSLTIGIYLFFLGVGSIFCEKPRKSPLRSFICLEMILSITGAVSVSLIFILSKYQFVYPNIFLLISHSVIAWIGFLSGMEIPLLTQLLGGNKFAKILGFDYFGSLIGTVVFALYLHSELGLVVSSIVVASFNILISVFCVFKTSSKRLKVVSLIILTSLISLLWYSDQLQQSLRFFYQASYISHLAPNSTVKVTKVIQTPYQVITEGYGQIDDNDGTKLFEDNFIFLDKGPQLGTTWFKPYHQAFAGGGLLHQENDKLNILILGGGDLLLAQDLLGSGRVKHIDLVDIDQVFIDYLKTHPYYSRYNQYAHSSKLVDIHVKDAFLWVRKKIMTQQFKSYDLIFMDFASLQDSDKSIHIFSKEFFTWCSSLLNETGHLITWVYEDKKHQELMSAHYLDAGFSHKKEYRAFTMKNLKDKTFSKTMAKSYVQTFWSLSKTNSNPAINIQGFSAYQKLLSKTIQIEKFTKLKKSKQVLNSIFKPNYHILMASTDSKVSM